MAAVAAAHISGTRGTSCSQIHTCLMLWPFFTPRPQVRGKKNKKLPSGYLRPFTRKSYRCFIPVIYFVFPTSHHINILHIANMIPSFSIHSFFFYYYNQSYILLLCIFVALIMYIITYRATF